MPLVQPEVGQWLNEKHVGFAAAVKLYRYVGNSPKQLDAADPSQLWEEKGDILNFSDKYNVLFPSLSLRCGSMAIEKYRHPVRFYALATVIPWTF